MNERSKAINHIKAAVKSLRTAAEIFCALQDNEAEHALDTLVVGVAKIFGNEILKTKMLSTKDPIVKIILEAWKNEFPTLGRPSPRDLKAVNTMTGILSDEQRNAGFILKIIQHYKQSTADWCKYKELYILANNYRKFIDGPLRNLGEVVIDRTNSDRTANGFAGMPGIELSR